jgi:phage shock protein PspC (stress-responsive transcriptional regulator)
MLRRSRTDRVAAGVAGGLGEYFDVDPVLFRVLFATAAFFGGVGVLAYLLAWAVIPEQATPHAAVDHWIGTLRRRRVPVWLVIGLGGLIAWGIGFSWWVPRPFLPLLVVAVILAGLIARRGPTARPGPSERPAEAVDLAKPMPAAARSGPEWMDETRRWIAEATAAARERRRRARPALLATLGTLVAALGALAVTDAVWGVAIPVYFWVGFATVVLGLLVGLVLRRTPWSTAVLLVPAVAGIVAFGGSRASMHDGFGQRQWTPTGAPQGRYALGFGQGILDLRHLAPLDGPHPVDVVLGAGQVQVLLPATMNATVNATIHLGRITVDGTPGHQDNQAGGFDLSRVVLPPASTRGPAITITVHATDGEILIRHG